MRTNTRDDTAPYGDNHSVTNVLNRLLADTFAIYLKTKNFHWHVSGPHFREYHLMLDEQATQIFATADVIAERVRKLGDSTIKSIGHIARLQRIEDNDAVEISAQGMLAELLQDNRRLVDEMGQCHALCDGVGDVATASLLETWIDEAQSRAWFLYEASQPNEAKLPVL
jgi:starvation-inducible DNA-binding protein